MITGITMAEISSADVRHWSNLPANVFLARSQIPNGLRDFLVRTPNGALVGRQFNFQGEKNIIYVRVFRDRATMLASNDISSGFASIAQPIPFVLKNPVAPLIPPNGQPQADIKR